jgi:hypothetical protein
MLPSFFSVLNTYIDASNYAELDTNIDTSTRSEHNEPP